MALLSALLALPAFSLSAHLGSHALALLRPVLRPAPPPAARRRPAIALLRPAKGLDPLDLQTLESSFAQDHPDFEVIFCVEDPADPACAALRAMIARHPQVPARLLVGQGRIGANPKLNNLAKGVAATRAPWIVMADANLDLPPDYLGGLMDSWQSGTGLVSGPPFGDRAQGLWGAVECAFLNATQARWQLAADVLGLGFAQGKTLMWRRDVLESGGGLPALARDTAEDVGATKMVRAMGLRVRLPSRLSRHPVGRRSARAVWDRQLRWSVIRRQGFPALFALEILQGPLPGLLALLAAGLAGAAPLALLPGYLGLWYAADAAFCRRYGLRLRPVDLAAALLRDLMLPALWLGGILRRDFQWRGTAIAPGTGPASETAR